MGLPLGSAWSLSQRKVAQRVVVFTGCPAAPWGAAFGSWWVIGTAAHMCRGCAVIFGYTEAQISAFFLTYGVGAFMAFMLFIIGNLAWQAKAGKFGTFVMFLGLSVGFTGFLAKLVIQWLIKR